MSIEDIQRKAARVRQVHGDVVAEHSPTFTVTEVELLLGALKDAEKGRADGQIRGRNIAYDVVLSWFTAPASPSARELPRHDVIAAIQAYRVSLAKQVLRLASDDWLKKADSQWHDPNSAASWLDERAEKLTEKEISG